MCSITIIGINIINICNDSRTPISQPLGWKAVFFYSSKLRRPLTLFHSLEGHPEVAWPHIFWQRTCQCLSGLPPNRYVQSANKVGGVTEMSAWNKSESSWAASAPALRSRPGSDFVRTADCWEMLNDTEPLLRGEKFPSQLDGTHHQDSQTLREPSSLNAAAVCFQHRATLPLPSPQPSSSLPVKMKTDGWSFSDFLSLYCLMSQENPSWGKIKTLSFHFPCLLDSRI